MISSPKAQSSVPGTSAKCARPALAAALVVALTLGFAGGSVQLSPQGNQFLRAAQALQTRGEFELIGGRTLAFFPPLYALLLAGLGRVGLAPIPAVVLLNAAVVAAGLWAFRSLAFRAGIRAGRTATFLFAALAANAYYFRMVRPDAMIPVFTMLTALALLTYKESRRRRWLFLAALACGTAALARYMALFTVLPVAAAALWRHPVRREARTADLAWFVPVALAPIGAWLARTWFLTGYPTGMSRTAFREEASATGLLDNIAGIAKTISIDLFGPRAMGLRAFVQEHVPLPHATATAVLTATGVGLIVFALVSARREWAERRRSSAAGAAHARKLVVSFAVWYVVMLVILWTIGNNDPLHTRFVAPLYWCLVLLAFLRFESVRDVPARRAAAGAWIVVALLVAATNVDKTLLLLRASPSDNMIKKSLRRPDDLWVDDLAWDRPHFLMPRVGSKPKPREKE